MVYTDRQDRLRNALEAEQRKKREGRLLDRKLGVPNKRHMPIQQDTIVEPSEGQCDQDGDKTEDHGEGSYDFDETATVYVLSLSGFVCKMRKQTSRRAGKAASSRGTREQKGRRT